MSKAIEETAGRQAGLHARRAIERAMLAIREVPLELDRPALAQRLGRAVQCCYAVIDSEVIARVHYDGLREAESLVAQARALLPGGGDDAPPALRSAGDALGLATSALKLGVEQVAQIQLARRLEIHGGRWDDPVPPARPFRASRGVPACHAIARLPMTLPISLDPTVELPDDEEPPPPPAPPRTMAELATLVERAAELARVDVVMPEEEPEPVLAYHPAVGEVEWLWRLGRNLLEDIAVGRDLRKPNPIETWLDQAPFEESLLARLDAFVALGEPVLGLVSLYHAEAEAPDPGRAFAAALVLGSIDGTDTAGAAVAILRTSPPEELDGWIEGLSLAPSRAIDEALLEVAGDARDDLVVAAAAVLHARGALPDGTLRTLCRRHEAPIALAATRALRDGLDDGEALAELGLRAEDPQLRAVACESLAARQCRAGREALRAALARALDDDLAWLLCLAGEAGDAELLFEWARTRPSVLSARGLGRFGHAGGVAVLLDLLALDDDEISEAAAEALERVTGAGLRETVELPWDFELPPNAAEVSGVPLPTRKVERATVDLEAWRRWVSRSWHRFAEATRWRHGEPFRLTHLVDELESALTPPARRGEVALELRIRLAAPFRFSADDWVARQKEDLAALRQLVAKAHFAAGTWDVASAAASRPPKPSADADHDPLMGTMAAMPAFFVSADGKVLPFAGTASPPPKVASSAPPPAASGLDDTDPLGGTLDPNAEPPAALPFRSAPKRPSSAPPPSRHAPSVHETRDQATPPPAPSGVDDTDPLGGTLDFTVEQAAALPFRSASKPTSSAPPPSRHAPVHEPPDGVAPPASTIARTLEHEQPPSLRTPGVDQTLEDYMPPPSVMAPSTREGAPMSTTPDLPGPAPRERPVKPATPFETAGAPPPKRQSSDRLPPATPFDTTAVSPQAAATPVQQPQLSIERFAWLCVREPYGAEYLSAALAKCGVRDLAQWQRWKAYWGARISADPALRARWEQAVAQYRPR